MTRTITILTATVLALGGPAVFGQTGAQAGGQASGSASAQASQSGAQASTGAAGSASASGAQGGQQGSSQGALANGTALNAQLSQPIDSKKCKAGDPVTARTTEPTKSEGKTVLPKGTKLVGHVTRASARSKGDAESALAVQFDRAILKDGREIPLQASIQALAAAQTVAAVGGDDLQGAGGAGGGGRSAGGSSAGSGRGVLGGTGSVVGGAASGAASTVPRTVVGATEGVGSTVGATANSVGHAGTGLNAAGELTSTSRGVFGLNGVNLASGATNSAEGSLITSAGKNVHLDSGTQMLLVTQAASSASAQR